MSEPSLVKDRFVQGKAFAGVELVAALLIIAGGLVGVVPFSSTPFLFVLAWICLRLRRVGWRSVGLLRPASSGRAMLIGAVIGAVLQVFSLYLLEPFIAKLIGRLPDVSMFANLVGNTFFLLISLLIAWTLAAFGEEMVYRGYLLNRMARLFGENGVRWVLAIILTSILFGLVHLYQGTSGMITTGFSGLVCAIAYFANGRNLWAPIVAHGVYDTIGFVLIYVGRYPGM
jgi:membrane protease YdiL (CAAX protease family)